MRTARRLLCLALLVSSVAACGRVKSCVKAVIRRDVDDDDDGPKAPPVHTGPVASTPIGPHPRIWLDPKTLETLRQRVAAKTPTWAALDARCKSLMEGPVEYPDGKDYPSPGIGEGYQGSDYWNAALDLALCGITLKTLEPARAHAVAIRVADVLDKMNVLDGPHAVNPLRDDGFGIRFFVTTSALAYDWLYDDLPPDIKERVRANMIRWFDIWDVKGFGRDHPQGNYFAGYYDAKALAALATQGDHERANIWWDDWLNRLHKQMVQPYYAKHMAGGGWPEGWNYGSFATLHMTWPVWAAEHAKNLDLFKDPSAPYKFPFEQAQHIVHFSWPDRIHIDDRGTFFDGEFDEVATTPIGPISVLPAFLRSHADPFAPTFQGFAKYVHDKSAKKKDVWQEFLYWDPSAPEAPLDALPKSFVAWGMQTVAMRSAWDERAVWASFTSGTYVGSPDSGEMYFDQGSLAVVRGARPLLVNATTALKRLAKGEPEPKGDDPIYDDLFGNHDKNSTKGNRTLFNVFYARKKPLPGLDAPDERYGQISAIPDKAKTNLARFEDNGTYVLMRGEKLEDMYRRGPHNAKRVGSWTRQVLYVRPGVFVVDDRTELGDSDLDQYLSFHLAAPVAPRARGQADGETTIFDSGDADRFAGSFATVLPKRAATKTTDVFDRHKVVRVDVRPPNDEKTQRWLSVIDASAVAPGLTKVRALDNVVGAEVESAPGSVVVVVAADGGVAKYRAPTGASATHYVTDLQAKGDVRVTATKEGAAVTVSIERGSGFHVSDGGVIAFKIDDGGQAVPVGR